MTIKQQKNSGNVLKLRNWEQMSISMLNAIKQLLSDLHITINLVATCFASYLLKENKTFSLTFHFIGQRH